MTDKPRIRIEPDWPQLAIALNATPEHVVALTRTTDRLERICDELQRLPVSTVVLTREEQQAIDRAINQLSPIADRLDNALAEVIEP